MKIIKKIFIILIIAIIVYNPNLALAESDDLVEIIFAEDNMYNKVCSELADYIEEKDASKRIVKIRANNINNIKRLSIRNSEISKISGIEKFTALEELDISNNNIQDISYISSLTNLTKLNMYGINIKSLSPINNLTKLTELNASRNTHDTVEFTDLTSISELVNLEKLDMSHNLLQSTNGIEKFPKLKELNLFDNIISDFSGLDTLKDLEYLSIGENNEKNKYVYSEEDLAKINELTNLKYLNFAENRTPNIINHIDKLVNLEYLSLEYNVITDATNLSNLTNLKTLILYNNSISDIRPLLTLKNLTELSVGKNKIKDVSYFFEEDVFLLPNIKKLDIINNSITIKTSQNELKALVQMDRNRIIQLDYEPTADIVDFSNLPHYDKNGVAYVTYEDFGARADGNYDDFIAMRNAHHFANDNNCEVRATAGKTYHIYKYYENACTIKTNTDWNGATIIIHDENIEGYSGKFLKIFNIKNINEDVKEYTDITWTVNKNTKAMPQLKDKIDALNEKGYAKYLVYVEDSNKKQYIRYGADANSGATMQDYCTIDKECNVLDDIQWDFDQITKLQIIPIGTEKFTIKNGNFITNSFVTQSEQPYIYNANGKGTYYYRNLYFNYCGNLTISNINHTVTTTTLSGSYAGFLMFDFCSDTEILDCSLYTHKYTLRSTYDFNMKRMINLHIKNVTSNDIRDTHRWGIIGSNYCKYVTYENCTLNRIDAHCGIYNIDVIDSTVGCKGLTMTGQGTLNLINTRIIAGSFISLRGDYGATWDGDMNIINCTHEFDNSGSPILFRYAIDLDPDGTPHDFGYPCKFPNVYVENLTMDYRNNTTVSSAFLILRTNVKSTETDWEEWYMPEKFVINGFKLLNGSKPCKILKTKYRFDNFDLTYQVEEGTTVGQLKQAQLDGCAVKTSNGDIVPDIEEIKTGMRFVLNDKCEFVIETTSKFLLGDIDGDKKITVNDLAQLKLHLIGEEMIEQEKRLKVADIDGDKKITVNDLAKLKLILIGEEHI